MKIRSVGTELFHAVGQTDRQTERHDEPLIFFRDFAKGHKNRLTCMDNSIPA